MERQSEYLLVDGYNIIHAWDELKAITEYSLEDARDRLINILSDYQGATNQIVIIVFDAHKVKGNGGSIEKCENITVVYTKEAETADNYIERAACVLSKSNCVRVATSDYLEQIIIIGRGALRMSANDLLNEVATSKQGYYKKTIDNKPIKKNLLLDNLDPETAELLEKMRYS